VVESEIKGVFIHRLKKNEDDRGWLTELYRNDELDREIMPVMSYISSTRPGVTRGPHEHRYQTDIFSFPGFSSFKIFLWDNRKNSPTFGRKLELVSDELSPLCLIIPPGVVHAYTNTGKTDGITINSANKLYKGEGKKEPVDEIRYEEMQHSLFGNFSRRKNKNTKMRNDGE
jgi:dTDP-4-dehydrorhamnose 3,5-epimerase